MSEERRKRLARLVVLHDRLQAVHEMRHATHLAAAHEAGREADDIAKRFDDPQSLSGLFPEVYHNRITGAVTRKAAKLADAEAEAQAVMRARLRAKRVAEAYAETARLVDEQFADRERLENATRTGPRDR